MSKMVFLNDTFWKCFQQDVDPSKLPGAVRDDDRGGWLIPEESLYTGKDYEEPRDKISVEGLDTAATRNIPTEEAPVVHVPTPETVEQKRARLLAELAELDDDRD